MKRLFKPIAVVLLASVLILCGLVACKDKVTDKGEITITIENKEQFLNISNQLGADYSKATFELTSDLDFTGEGFKPIGDSFDSAFTGKFNGNGHTIKGVEIGGIAISENNVFEESYVKTDTEFVGIFGYTVNAKIDNLKIEYDFRFCTDKNSTYVGGLIAYAFGNTVINNITVDGKIDVISAFKAGNAPLTGLPTYVNDKDCFIGGLVGYASGVSTINGVNGEIEIDCSENSGVVSGVSTATGYETNFTHYSRFNTVQVGGLCGFLRTIDISDTDTAINTVSDVSLVSQLLLDSDRTFAGGVFGSVYHANIANIETLGESFIYTDSHYRVEVGGLIALMDKCSLVGGKTPKSAVCVVKSEEGAQAASQEFISFVAGGAIGYVTNGCNISKIDSLTDIYNGYCLSYGGGIVGVMNNSALSDSTAKGKFINYYASSDSKSSFIIKEGASGLAKYDIGNHKYKCGGAVGKLLGHCSESVSAYDLSKVSVVYESFQGVVAESIYRVDVNKIGEDEEGEDIFENVYVEPVVDNATVKYVGTLSGAWLINYYDESGSVSSDESKKINGLGEAVENENDYNARLNSHGSIQE